jgi:hypothetical protein
MVVTCLVLEMVLLSACSNVRDMTAVLPKTVAGALALTLPWPTSDTQVTRGERHTLALWFTRSLPHAEDAQILRRFASQAQELVVRPPPAHSLTAAALRASAVAVAATSYV